MSKKPTPTVAQKKFLDRLVTGEPYEEVMKTTFDTLGMATTVIKSLRKRGWLTEEGLVTPEGAEAIGVNPEPFRLPPPPVIEAPMLPPDPPMERAAEMVLAEGVSLVEDDLVEQARHPVSEGPGEIQEAIEILERPRVERKTPDGARAQEIHDRLLERVQAVEQSFMAMAAEVALAYEHRIWEYMGYADPEAYFEAAIKLRFRTVLALKAIHEGVQRLPEAERPEAIRALAAVGRHRASVLAPVLGNDQVEGDWRHWVQIAQEKKTESALQAAVSQATGAQPRGRAAQPVDLSQKAFDTVVGVLPEKYRTRARATLMAYCAYLGDAAGGPPVTTQAALIAMLAQCEVELGAVGIFITVPDGS